MRNQYTHYHSGSSKIEVTEKKAPTDESIRLYDEFLEKAKGQLVHSVVVDTNVLKGAVFCFKNNFMSFSYTCFIKFLLNGKEYKLEVTVDPKKARWEADPKNELIKMLYKSISESIAQELIKENLETIYNIKLM